MIVEWTKKDRTSIRQLFEDHRRGRAIIFPALDQGRGNVWVNSLEAPTVARLQLAILNAVAGDCESTDALEFIQMLGTGQLVFAPDECWTNLLKGEWGNRIGIQHRTLLSPDSLNLDHLRKLRDELSPDYTLERMDLETIRRIDKRKAMHIPTFFGSSENFHRVGIGYCIKYRGEVVSMASTFTPFIDEFEIEVDTLDSDHRRKGLATVVSSALIIHALENGLVPQWDAANEASIHLALKLGYTNPDHWDAYYLKPSK
ncbi:MAG: GNAT family N-acetyltransferase [Candidatus Thorarchaeota archaeon]